jgi:ribonuclease HI
MNPYALYIKCDGSMDYDSKNTGGVGVEIIFPDSVNMETIRKSFGRYEGANIERIELEGIISGIEYIIDLYGKESDKLSNINTIIFITDRFRLNDKEGTDPYKIQAWRKNKWCNHEGRAIKNHDLLDKLDKKRKKLSEVARSKVLIEYRPRKQNKVADKLAKAGKQFSIPDHTIAIKGLKVGKRKYDGSEISYDLIKEEDEIHIHVFLKTPVNKQWEISAEVCEGINIGKKLRIYSDDKLAGKLHRRHEYKIKIKKVFLHHTEIYRTMKEIKNVEREKAHNMQLEPPA